MKFNNLTDQELADEIQAAIWKAVRLGTAATARACKMSATDPSVALVVPDIADMTGHLLQAHASATRAANAMPGVQPKFGGK